jgi:hypothetical protein
LYLFCDTGDRALGARAQRPGPPFDASGAADLHAPGGNRRVPSVTLRRGRMGQPL